MSGKLCVGGPINNVGAARISRSKAFCEGLQFRAGGTLAGRPASGNPHPLTSPDGVSWSAGWIVADAAAPAGTIDPADAACCSVAQNVVVDV